MAQENSTIFFNESEPKSQEQLSSSTICSICLSNKMKELLSVGCSHSFCQVCLTQHVLSQIQEYQVIKCPQEQCEQIIDRSEISIYHKLTPKDQEIIDILLDNYKRIYNPLLCYQCQEGHLIETIYEEKTAYVCNSCQQHFCYNCRQLYHIDEGQPCIAGNLPPSCQQCSRCLTILQKTRGCKHMKCPCGYQFCFQCGFHWQKNHLCEHKKIIRQGCSFFFCCLMKILFGIVLTIAVIGFIIAFVSLTCFMNAMLGGLVIWIDCVNSIFKSSTSKVAPLSARNKQENKEDKEISLRRKQNQPEEQKKNNLWDCLVGIFFLLLMPFFFFTFSVPCFFIPLINLCLEQKIKPDLIPLTDLGSGLASFYESFMQM